jgi:hypothetical protein
MEPTFERIFRDKGAMRLWFARTKLAGAVAPASFFLD